MWLDERPRHRPHEAAVRAWLRRWMPRDQEIDDVIQEAYCRLAALEDITHIGSGRPYLFQTTHNIVLDSCGTRRSPVSTQVTDMASFEYRGPGDSARAGSKAMRWQGNPTEEQR